MLRRICAIVFLLLAALGVATAQPLDTGSPEENAHLDITALIQQSTALALPARVERAFMLTLNAASDAYLRGQFDRAVTLLRTFTFEVRGVKRAKRLPPATADALIARAELAIGTLSPPR